MCQGPLSQTPTHHLGGPGNLLGRPAPKQNYILKNWGWQPFCWLFLSFGYLNYVGSRFFLWEPPFLYRGKLGVFRDPDLVPPSLYFLTRGKQLWLPASPGLPPWVGVEPLRRRGYTNSLAWPGGRGCTWKRAEKGEGKVGQTVLPFGTW